MNNDEHLEVIHRVCGKGKHSRVSVVRRESDGKLFIWKRPVSSSHIHKEAFKKEFKKSKFWRKHGLSKVEVRWHPDRRSLLKTLVKGPTLRDVLKEDRHFFYKKGNKKYSALKEFFWLLVKSGHYIGDVSPKNIAWDGQRWQIIDSSSIHEKENRSSLKQKYREKILNKWVINFKFRGKDIISLKSFADSI